MPASPFLQLCSLGVDIKTPHAAVSRFLSVFTFWEKKNILGTSGLLCLGSIFLFYFSYVSDVAGG